MNDDKNKPLNPDDYWPEMEQMLDKHFVAQKRRRVLWIALLLLIGSSTLFMFLNKSGEKNTSLETITIPQTESTVNTKSTTTTQSKIEDNVSTATESNISSNVSTKTVTTTASPKNTSTEEISTDNKIDVNHTNKITIKHPLAISKKESVNSIKKSKEEKEVRNSSLIVKNNENSETNSIAENKITTTKNITSDINKLEVITPASAKTIPFLPAISANYSFTTRPSDTIAGVNTFIPAKKKKRFEMQVYAGANYIHDELKGNSTINYTERRNREESPVILPHLGASVSAGQGHWDFRAGIELSMLGQKIKYSPFSDGDVYTTNGDWQQYQYTVSDSDSTYILGIIFISTHQDVINDSTFITVTDTVRGPRYDASIAAANGVNKSYYIEVPLEVAYTAFHNKWGFGISAGISPAYLISTKGYYLTSDQSKIEQLNRETSTQLFLSGRINLELSYLISDRLRLMIRPTARKNLTEIRDGSSTINKFSSVGMNVGVSWKIR